MDIRTAGSGRRLVLASILSLIAAACGGATPSAAPSVAPSASANVAITPGGTKAYMTVSGPAGGYLYAFDALAKGVRQSNGG